MTTPSTEELTELKRDYADLLRLSILGEELVAEAGARAEAAEVEVTRLATALHKAQGEVSRLAIYISKDGTPTLENNDTWFKRAETAEAEVERLKLQLDNANKLWSPRIAMLESRATTAEVSLKVMAAKAQAVIDATTQDPAGAWIVEGDGELLFSDLSDALTSLDQPVKAAEAKLSALGGGENRRTPTDYAIEHAGYLGDAASHFLSCVTEFVAEDDEEAQEAHGASCHDSAQALRCAIHEFRKRANRALSTPANPWRPTREQIALEVRLAMQDEMLAPEHQRVQKRTERANKAADAILSLPSANSGVG